MANPGGYDPLAGGLKVRCLSIRLYARGPGCRLSGSDIVRLNDLVLPHGYDPRSFGYRPNALPLSYGRMVRRRGVEPRAFCMSRRRSAAETNDAYPFRDLNPGSRRVRPQLWSAKLKGRNWCATRDSNSDCTRSERVASAVGLVAHGAGGFDPPTSEIPSRCSTE
jgi:hypothetical protein